MNTENKPYERPEGMTPWGVTKFHRDNQTNRTGFLGVRQNGRRFYASIRDTRLGKKVHIGSFATPEEAARAYDARALKLYGPEAVTNFRYR